MLDGGARGRRLAARGQGADGARRGRAAARGRPAEARRELVDAALESSPTDGRFARSRRSHARRIALVDRRLRDAGALVDEGARDRPRARAQGPRGAARSTSSRVYRDARLELDEASRLVAAALELAEESGSIVAPRPGARLARRGSTRRRGRLDEASARGGRRALRRGRRRVDARADVFNHSPGRRRARATTPAAERCLREAIRLLKPLEDRGALCESQRGARRGARPDGEARRGGAARAGGDRDGRPARHRSRGRRRRWRSGSCAPPRAGTRRRRRCCARRSRSSSDGIPRARG